MPVESVPGADLKYYLIAFDKDGRERTGDPDGLGLDGLMSRRILEVLRGEPVTDVFLLSHGWKGDIPAAREQYNAWIGAMARNEADRERMRQSRPGFRSLLVGFHWPSQPWGDEQLGGGVAFDLTDAPSVEDQVNEWAARIADTGPARDALKTIFAAAQRDLMPDNLPPDVKAAYETLNREAGLGGDGAAGAPGADREPFDPEQYYQVARLDDMLGEAVDFGGGGFSLGGLLSPLKQLSFWTMKARARKVGESGGSRLLADLQQVANAKEEEQVGMKVRFHLMGHSFGCIVVSSMLCGEGGQGQLMRPVDSLTLVQGAVSLWSYCASIEEASGQPGYFRSLIADRRVRGPIVTTRSRFDTAVGRFYPVGAGLAGQVDFDVNGLPKLPKYGGLGAFGIQGPGIEIVDVAMKPVGEDYGFEPGKVYNLEGSSVIREGGGASGAHSDIARAEIAHAVWEAARVSG
jgi:hypothetical protein